MYINNDYQFLSPLAALFMDVSLLKILYSYIFRPRTESQSLLNSSYVRVGPSFYIDNPKPEASSYTVKCKECSGDGVLRPVTVDANFV